MLDFASVNESDSLLGLKELKTLAWMLKYDIQYVAPIGKCFES